MLDDDHYTALLAEGWQATRWQHDTLGTMERLPTGGWRNTSPDGVAVEYGDPKQPGQFRITGATRTIVRTSK